MSERPRSRAALTAIAGELRTEVGRLWWHLRRPATRSGITPTQTVALAALAKHPEGLRQGDLAQLMNVSPASMTRLMEMLAEPRWVERAKDEQDQRAVVVRLTGEGQAALDQIGGESTSQLSALLAELTDDEVAVLEAAVPVIRKLCDRQVSAVPETPAT